MKTKIITILSMGIFLISCNNNENQPDAYGNFEVDEVTISAKIHGELMEFNLEEGQRLESGEVLGYIDTVNLHLKRAEIKANRSAAQAQNVNIEAQIKMAKDEQSRIKRDQSRIQSMFKDKAATQKQLDDINSAADIAQRKLDVLQTQYLSVKAQLESIEAQNLQLNQQLKDAVITNPFTGIVLTKMVNAHELLAPGRALYSIANLEEMDLKAFVSGGQLSDIQLGQEVNVFIDGSNEELKSYKGVISWISSEAEFTPKNIQTREERVAQVYAIKIRVKNDGSIKIGMPGEVNWSAE